MTDAFIAFIWYFFKRFFEVRVSSHKIKSDFFSISIALKVISPKLPIGVGTIYRPFFMDTEFSNIITN